MLPQHARRVLLIVLAAVFLAGGLSACDGLQQLLDQVAGKPGANDSSESISQPGISVPSGPQLYCISNVGHTLVVFDLTAQQVLPETRYYLDLDPVGPWFRGTAAYYISRVETTGAGSNALIEFNPKTAKERQRITFVANSNPTTLLLLPSHPDTAWVALRGSTFDNFATNGIAVVDLDAWTYTFIDLNTLAGTTGLTSLVNFVWDAACPSNGGTPCVYALVNNYDGNVRDGVLLVLGVNGSGAPTLLDTVPLGRNPQQDMLLDSSGRLWIVNNGGYPPHHEAGGVLALNTADWSEITDVVEALETGVLALVGIHGFDGANAWVTTFPTDKVYALGMATPFPLDTAPGLPTLTGPLFPTAAPAAALYAAKGGNGKARLAELNPATGALLASHDLQSGNGPVSCAETTVP